MIKQCSECPNTVSHFNAKTCSTGCSKKRKKRIAAAYYQNNKAEISQKSKQHYAANRKAMIERVMRHYYANPQAGKERAKKWNRAHPDVINRLTRARYKRLGGRGYRRHLPALLVKYGYICQIKGCELPRDHSKIDVDHIVPVDACIAMGWTKKQINDPYNLQPACPSCNYAKGNQWDGTMPGEPPAQMDLFE